MKRKMMTEEEKVIMEFMEFLMKRKMMAEEKKVIMEAKEEKFIMEEEEEELEILSWLINTLPQDIQMEILSWVPAKSLVSSFKFVSKAWHTLIHDSVFVKMHLSRGGRRRSSSKNIIWKPNIYDGLYQLHPSIDLKDLYFKPPEKKLVLDFVKDLSCAEAKKKYDFDFDDFDCDDVDNDFFSQSCSRLFGSCNGLLCLSINFDENILLLNPCTRKYKVSPRQRIERPSPLFISDNDVTYGFACYSNTNTNTNTMDDDDEYKVVRIANFYIDNHERYPFLFQIDLYSMSSNSWRRWSGDIPFEEIYEDESGVFLNGAVHWMGSKLRRGPDLDTIVSFNIRDEEFLLMPPPPPSPSPSPSPCVAVMHFLTLLNVRGCLGCVYYVYDYYASDVDAKKMSIEIEIWVMKEYGIRESWTKEFVIRTSDSSRELSGFSRTVRLPMICSLTGDQVMIQNNVYFKGQVQSSRHAKPSTEWRKYRRTVLYDINKKKIDGDVIMESDYPNFSLIPDLVDYNETLVSLTSLPLGNNRKRRRNCN